MVRDIQDRIIELKKQTGAVIAAHSYQSEEILEIADYKGDSFKLSIDAAATEAETVIMCGVHFMAETLKLLSPQKKVILAHPGCGCAMADQISPDYVREYKSAHPNAVAVCYINTTAALKAECDVCVTSSSALKIVAALEGKEILFVPDQNLGGYVSGLVSDKEFRLFDGCCPVHDSVTAQETEEMKAAHPGALLLVHPECRSEVAQLADYVGSTSGIVDFALKSDAEEFIIGTEISIANSLSYMLPDKKIHILSKKLICPDMRITTLNDVYNSLLGRGGEEISIDPAIAAPARRCIDKMIELG